MPPKVKALIDELVRNGFSERGGKGSHRNYFHPLCSKIVTISGKKGNDAQHYQTKQVEDAIREVKSK